MKPAIVFGYIVYVRFIKNTTYAGSSAKKTVFRRVTLSCDKFALIVYAACFHDQFSRNKLPRKHSALYAVLRAATFRGQVKFRAAVSHIFADEFSRSSEIYSTGGRGSSIPVVRGEDALLMLLVSEHGA
jgi:hypothetical protein